MDVKIQYPFVGLGLYPPFGYASVQLELICLLSDISGGAFYIVARDSQFDVPHLDLLRVQVYSRCKLNSFVTFHYTI